MYMGLFASEKDERDAYRTSEGMAGRSFRRGMDKAAKWLTLGLITHSNPLSHAASDAATEIVTKVIPRSRERRENNDED
jgi:hypothetical protein